MHGAFRRATARLRLVSSMFGEKVRTCAWQAKAKRPDCPAKVDETDMGLYRAIIKCLLKDNQAAPPSTSTRSAWGTGYFLDRDGRAAGFFGDGLVLFLDDLPSGRIAVEAAKGGTRDSPVGGAGAVFVENIEKCITAFDRL